MATGTLHIISAPSGAGKTSLVKRLLETVGQLTVSISHTTRSMRPGEESGVHYHFVDDAEFDRLVSKGAFLEHAQVFGNRYGTSREAVEELLNSGKDVILEIDWQGAQQVRSAKIEYSSIFILPPGREALEQRLQSRGQDSDDIIAQRMAEAVQEMSHYHEFDYLVINDDFDTAVQELSELIRSRRLGIEVAKQVNKGLIDALLA